MDIQEKKVLDITIPSFVTIDKVGKLTMEFERQGMVSDFKREANGSFHMKVEVDPNITPDKIEEINQLAVSITH